MKIRRFEYFCTYETLLISSELQDDQITYSRIFINPNLIKSPDFHAEVSEYFGLKKLQRGFRHGFSARVQSPWVVGGGGETCIV